MIASWLLSEASKFTTDKRKEAAYISEKAKGSIYLSLLFLVYFSLRFDLNNYFY